MKKIRVIVYLIILMCFTWSINVFASTKVYTRTESDYLVPDDIIITESNRSKILSTPAIDASEKVYDFAQLLTESEERQLYNQISQFIKKNNLDFAIVTISTNNKGNAKDYAHDFYDYNKFDTNGILLLIDMQNREIYMTTTGRAVQLFPDVRMNSILSNVYGKVSEKRYYEACSIFIKLVDQFANMGTNYNEDVVVSDDGIVSKNMHVGEVLIFSSIGTLVVIIIMVCSNRMVHKATSSKEFLNKSTMKIEHISEVYLGSHTTKTPISSSSSSGGGSSGISISRGSSGRSHGGSGHKF